MKKKAGKLQILYKLGSIFMGVIFVWGLLYAGWSAIMVVAGYWIEEVITFVLTGFTLLLLRISGRKPVYLGKFFFFLGTFLIFHTIFILILAGIASKSDPMALRLFEMLLYPFAKGNLVLDSTFMNSIKEITLFVLGTVLYGLYFSVIHKGKWRNIDIRELVNKSFRSFITPHLVIMFGIGAFVFLGVPDFLALILVLIKVFIDVTGFGAKGGQIVKTDS
jgi:Family of unknown function (DUF6498)